MENQDKILNMFLLLVEKEDLAVSLTIFINGQIISGLAISTKQYLQSMVNDFKNSQEKTVNVIGEGIEKAINPLKISEEIVDNSQYINMKDVCIIDTDNNKLNLNACLRFRVDKISGFMLGAINPLNNIE